MKINTEKNGKTIPFSLNAGSSSILMIFVILCLVCLAVLSIISASSDNKLSKRILERTSAYYNACNEAEKALSGVDHTLTSIYLNSADADAYFNTVGHNKSYIISISDLQTLQVNIEILYPESDEDTFYRITSWQVLNTGTVE